MIKHIAADIALAIAVLAAGYSIPSFDNPFECVPELHSSAEFLACLDG
ncbi:hypothetical protein HLB23_21320 [Nocardia uniformis]|uniref:Uncharacterized protein n=1 Tax=Nocardia uniformis TaxID=53432 RepID=A0A849C3M5_9NOCA|nr:hypothetical protein [Nocardia uniformis]NNH72368.1 hypothetical protein [Nocardia uniformis]